MTLRLGARLVRPFLLTAATASVLVVASSALAQPPARAPAAVDQARAYAAEGSEAVAAGRWDDAVRLFEQADSVYATPNYKYYAAQAYAKLGKLRAAAALYRAAAQALPRGAPEVWKAAQAEAAKELEALEPRLPAVSVTVTGPARADARLSVDGRPVTQDGWDRVELDPGPHEIRAEAPGYAPAEQKLTLGEGKTEAIALTLVLDAPKPANVEPVAPSPRPTPVPAPSDLSHDGQWGLFGRADVEVLHGGALGALGVSWGALSFVDLQVAALLGRDKGAEIAVQLDASRGAWKPYVSLGAPLFFAGEVSVGVRGAVGLEWDPSRHVGVFVQMGGAYFPQAPEGYASGALLPAAGISGRL